MPTGHHFKVPAISHRTSKHHLLMSNTPQKRKERFRAENKPMSYHAQANHSRTSSYQPPMANYNRNVVPHENGFATPQHYHTTSSLHTERAYLLTTLQREDLRATSLLAAITDINVRLESSTPTRSKEMKALRKNLGSKKRSAEMSMRQEKWILLRLGQVTFLIQQRERWERVERERRMAMASQICGEWNGSFMAGEVWQGQHAQQAPYMHSEAHTPAQFASQEWYHQVPVPGFAVEMPGTPVHGSGYESLSGWQTHASGASPVCWQMSAAPESAMKLSWMAKSDSTFEAIGSRRGDWNRMSVPNFASGPWKDGEPRYIGYYPRRPSEEISVSNGV